MRALLVEEGNQIDPGFLAEIQIQDDRVVAATAGQPQYTCRVMATVQIHPAICQEIHQGGAVVDIGAGDEDLLPPGSSAL